MNASNIGGRKVLFAASMVSMVLGSIHAFSVFLEPLENTFCPAIYARPGPSTILAGVACLAAFGAGPAGVADRLEIIWIG